MALQIITGDLSVDKKSRIIKKLLEIKEQDPQAIIYYLVPEHIKFDMETRLLKEIQQLTNQSHSAMIDLQVVSFTRLTWFMLNQQSTKQLNLSEIGLSMIIRQILEANQTQLQVYQGQQNHLGFVEKLLILFEELYQGNLLPEDLASDTFAEWESTQRIYNMEERRLYELKLLYQEFIKAIETHELANYQSYQQLSQFFQSKEELPHHYIVIDHHYFFNAQQYQLLVDLIKKFKQVWVTLPLTHQETQFNDWQPIIQVAKETYHHLTHLVQLFNLEKDIDWDISHPNYNYRESISFLANAYKEQQTRMINQVHLNSKEHHHLWQFDTPQNELRHISNQIHFLVSQKGYRYRDILVVTRDMDRYQQIIGPYFEMNDIPYFYDHEVNMSQHPFVLLLEAIFNLAINHWRYEDLMIVLKSDLIVPEWIEDNLEELRHQKALIENILIANGYFGYRFYSQSFEWQFETQDLAYVNVKGETTNQTMGEIANQWRQWIMTHLYRPLVIWKDAFNGQKACEWLYHLLVDSQIQSRLIYLRDQAIEEGKIETSRRYEQVWQVLMNTLDEFCQLYQQTTTSFKLFSELLMTGLSQATYHIIPPTMDQVTVTSMESPQVNPSKICFVLGLDDLTLPKSYVLDSLLTKENRTSIKEHLLPYQSLTDGTQQRNQLEPLIAYQLLLNATEELYVSYATTVNGQTRTLSHLFANLYQAAGIEAQRFYLNDHPFLSNQIHSNQLGKAKMQLSPLLGVLRRLYQSTLLLSSNQQLLFKAAIDNNPHQRSWKTLIKQIFNFNVLPSNLSKETAISLFGKNLTASVSKIEQYYQDPFSHFLIYGLRLKEREQYQIDAAKAGDYFHQAMDIVLKQIIDDHKNLNSLTPSEIADYLKQALTIINDDWHFNIFDSHPRMQAIKLQMDQQLWQFLLFSQEQMKRTRINTLQTEAIFGFNSQSRLNGFQFPLKSGGTLSITGKIDRIDEIPHNNKLQVIDYKSGNKNFNLVDAYYGHDLQILTYLNVALQHYDGYEAIGAFYQPLIQGFQEATPKIIDSLKDQTFMDYHLAENRLNGFITVSPDELINIEPLMSESNKSDVYRAKVKKDGKYDATTVYFNENELQLLLSMTNQRFVEAADEIQNGKIELAPYKDNPFTTSLQTPYRVISGFDATEHYHLYRHKKLKKSEIISAIKNDFDRKENDND